MILRRNRLGRGMTAGVLGTNGRRQLRSGADVARGAFSGRRESSRTPHTHVAGGVDCIARP